MMIRRVGRRKLTVKQRTDLDEAINVGVDKLIEAVVLQARDTAHWMAHETPKETS